jgi:NAD(P)H-dependent FMN reductase
MDAGAMDAVIPILLISGSTRGASTNTALLRTAHAIAPSHVAATLFAGMTALPHFNPDDDRDEPAPADDAAAPRRHPAVIDLHAALAASRAVLFCTPEYAGAPPGSFKNLLDWCVGAGALYGKPVGWINVSTSPTGASGAHASLATVLGYLGAQAFPAACVHIPVARNQIGADGLIADQAIRARIVATLDALIEHAQGPAPEGQAGNHA